MTKKMEIGRINSDPLIRGMLVQAARLFHRDFPAGLKHPTKCPRQPFSLAGVRGRTHCFLEDLTILGITVADSRFIYNTYRINPEFADFVHGDEDQDYVDAIIGWLTYSDMREEVSANA